MAKSALEDGTSLVKDRVDYVLIRDSHALWRKYRLGIVFGIEIWSKDAMLTSAVKIIGTQNQSI